MPGEINLPSSPVSAPTVLHSSGGSDFDPILGGFLPYISIATVQLCTVYTTDNNTMEDSKRLPTASNGHKVRPNKQSGKEAQRKS